MTAFTGSTDCPPARLAATRGGLHRVAEHVLAGALYAASGEIGLIPSPGGFRRLVSRRFVVQAVRRPVPWTPFGPGDTTASPES